jgi:tetratricopeptide (TPR) repeat protein
LPLEAAETTGTVAVARWGRVTMLSPRAARNGYPWQDTLAHEITHLALTRGSRDYAPLWLQEGIAKREETRWRSARPFDDKRDASRIAKQALLSGESVGIDKIGPSIAMLPTAKAANISYAEVQSFMHFWIERNGRAAFTLLLLDLKGLATRETDEAMLSITGYPLSAWIQMWQQHLLSLPEPPAKDPEAADESGSVVQSIRLGDLLTKQGHITQASEYFEPAVEKDGRTPAVRFRAAAAQVARGDTARASQLLGTVDDLSALHAGWLGLHGRLLQEGQQLERALEAFSLAVAIDPYSEEAACEGHSARTQVVAPPAVDPTAGAPANAPAVAVRKMPEDPTRRRLCEEARAFVRD